MCAWLCCVPGCVAAVLCMLASAASRLRMHGNVRLCLSNINRHCACCQVRALTACITCAQPLCLALALLHNRAKGHRGWVQGIHAVETRACTGPTAPVCVQIQGRYGSRNWSWSRSQSQFTKPPNSPLPPVRNGGGTVPILSAALLLLLLSQAWCCLPSRSTRWLSNMRQSTAVVWWCGGLG